MAAGTRPTPDRWVRPMASVVVGVVVVGGLAALSALGSATPDRARIVPPPVSSSTTTPTSSTTSLPPALTGRNEVFSGIGEVRVGVSIDTETTIGPGDTGVAVPASTAPPAASTTLPPAPTPAVTPRTPPADPPSSASAAPPAPWASSVVVTRGGHVSTDVGCASDLSASGLDAFFAERVGPVIGWDYQHVYPLGGDRFLWLFQDTFVDHRNTATTLDAARFVHNTAMVQDGRCFRLLHRGSVDRPQPFELGTGTASLTTWFWPMGGEVHGGRLYVFWARMVKDAVDPPAPDGLGWHPDSTFVGVYDPETLERIDFRSATQPATDPIYGYAMQSDGDWTYLFGNTFEQNLSREGGLANGPHSATRMYLARVPRGDVFAQPTYWTSDGWTGSRPDAEPILQRHWAEFPFQPRLIDGTWVASTAVDGYWGDEFTLDVADDPWGPWTTVEAGPLDPRAFDPLMNTYHAHLMPWREANGDLVVSISNNARDMERDAWPNPWRYRPTFWPLDWRDPAPATTTTTTSTTTTVAPADPTTSTTEPLQPADRGGRGG